MNIKNVSLIILLLFSMAEFPAMSQTRQSTASEVVRQKNKQNHEGKSGKEISERFKTRMSRRKTSDSNRQWAHVVYRELLLDNPQNEALTGQEYPDGTESSLFRLICEMLSAGKINAYEYSDGAPRLTDANKISSDEIFKKFGLRTDNSTIDDFEIECYYIEESRHFDALSGRVKTEVTAICPVIKQYSEIGYETARYPFCWLKMEELNPYLLNCLVSDGQGNSVRNHTLDSFFAMNLYHGQIYRSGRGKTLYELYPDETARNVARDSIEHRLASFERNLHFSQKDDSITTKTRTKKIKSDKNVRRSVRNDN